MYKIAILGCENSHANAFLNFIIKDKKYPEIEVVGVYSDEKEAAEKISAEYGVPIMASYDMYAGQLDGVVITARHGDNHYKYAKPYLKDKIPLFIDKPITVSKEDANEFYHVLKENNIRVCGGSCCALAQKIKELKKIVQEKSEGEVFGGFLRAPIVLDNIYGGFFFYAQHLAEIMCEIFGYFPESVKAFKNEKIITYIVRYKEYDVCLEYTDGCGLYTATVSCEKKLCGGEYDLDGCFEEEFEEFNSLLLGDAQKKSYEEFFAPVSILNAMYSSLENGNEVRINYTK